MNDGFPDVIHFTINSNNYSFFFSEDYSTIYIIIGNLLSIKDMMMMTLPEFNCDFDKKNLVIKWDTIETFCYNGDSMPDMSNDVIKYLNSYVKLMVFQ